MLSWIGKWRSGEGTAAMAPPAPDRPLAVVGDVHGCDDLLGRLLDRLAREEPDRQVVLVGDLIDRGEDSAGVIRRLMGRPEIVVLGGNHEEMLLELLDMPELAGTNWVRNGGLQTLASYGIGGLGVSPPPEALAEAARRLRAAMGEEAVAWLRARPLWARTGNVAVVHGGADPDLALELQPRTALLWGHRRFGHRPRPDGLWVAFGHVIRPEPFAEGGLIGMDTGAYATGRLTAALVDRGSVRFVEA